MIEKHLDVFDCHASLVRDRWHGQLDIMNGTANLPMTGLATISPSRTLCHTEGIRRIISSKREISQDRRTADWLYRKGHVLWMLH